MSGRRKLPTAVRQRVRERAQSLCEYCHASERWQYVRFTIDHVIPRAQGGTDSMGNLALACFHGNRQKANRTTVVISGSAPIRLFNPRRDAWHEHFVWSIDGLLVVGLTPLGQATITALDLNRDWAVRIRAVDRALGRHPPSDDPIQVPGQASSGLSHKGSV